jgi:hypothetical protein
MAQTEDPSFSPESTRRLFISLFWLIIVLPASAGAAIFAAFYLLGIPFDRKSMKLAILVIWLGTLACLAFFAVRNRRGRPSDDNGRIFERCRLQALRTSGSSAKPESSARAYIFWQSFFPRQERLSPGLSFSSSEVQ